MNLTVVSNIKNALIGRSEVSGSVVFDSSTPNRSEFKKAISGNLKVDESLVIVKSLDTVFGSTSAKFYVFVYDDEKKLSLFEQKYMVKRNSAEEKKEEPKEEKPKEETPKEEVKEEKKDDSPSETKDDAPKEEVKETPKEEKPVEEKKDVPGDGA